MRNSIPFAWAFVVVLAAFGASCASSKTNHEATTESAPAVQTPADNTGTVDTASNEEIGFEIRRRLNENPTETSGIVVVVDDGKVTLRGTAPNLQAGWRAEAAARSVKGVKQVTNQILVAGTAR